MASNIAWTSQGQETYMTTLVEWFSDSPNVIDYTSGSAITYPRNTPVMIQIQANFKYFLIKWQRNNDANIFNSYITPATEVSNMNIAYGGGQGFALLGNYSGSGGYKPQSSSLPPLMTADTEGTARRGSRLSIDNGVLSADIPTSADLITNMNTTHFTNNTGTSKIDISSSYVAPNATKLATSRNIAGVGFDGSGNIDIPYANLSSIPSTWGTSQIPDLGAGKITSGTFSTDRIPDLATAKITSGTFDVLRIPDLGTAKITSGTFDVLRIPDLGTAKITSGIFVDARIPDLATTKITSGIFDVLRIPDLATTKITSGTFVDARIPDLATTKITSGIFDVLRIPDLATTKITSGIFDVLRIPDLATTKITSGTFVDARIPNLDTAKITTGTFVDARIPNLDTAKITTGTFVDARIPSLAISKITGLQGALDAKQATINNTAGQLIIGNGNGETTTNTGLTFSGSTLTANNITISTNLVVNASAGIVGTSQFTGNVGIGTTSHATYKVDVLGDVNVSGAFRVGGVALANSWSAGTPSTNIFYNLGNVGIGTTNPFVPLQVFNTSAATLRMQTAAAGTPSIQLIRGDTTDASTDWIMSNNPTTGSYLITSSTSGTAVDRFVISNGGNIGIGTTNPLSRLHIENSSTALNPVAGITSIYVNNPTNSAGQNSVITNRIGGSAAGRCMYSFDVNAAYGFSIYIWQEMPTL
jgi:hypothetical protein